MSQILKFSEMKNLQILTLYANPIEHIKNYRLVVLNVLYRTLENLRKFDQVLITRQEYDNVMSLNNLNSVKNLRMMKVPANCQKKEPPMKKNDDAGDGRQS
jgi:hypothetical protein